MSKIIWPKPPVKDDQLFSKDTPFSEMLDKCRIALQREIYYIEKEGENHKLSNASAQNLRDYIKLLRDLSAEEKEEVQKMTEEQLKKESRETQQEPNK